MLNKLQVQAHAKDDLLFQTSQLNETTLSSKFSSAFPNKPALILNIYIIPTREKAFKKVRIKQHTHTHTHVLTVCFSTIKC